MADPIISNALNAYNAAAKAVGSSGMEARDTPGPSFGELLQNINNDAIQTGTGDEKQTMLAAAGQANVTDVVTAVSAENFLMMLMKKTNLLCAEHRR